MRLAMLGLLEPVFKEIHRPRGGAQRLQNSEDRHHRRMPRAGRRDPPRREIKVMRGDEQLFKGKVSSLQALQGRRPRVTNGMECGIGLSGFNDIKEGDLIEAFSTEKLAADLGALTSANGITRLNCKYNPAALQHEERAGFFVTYDYAVLIIAFCGIGTLARSRTMNSPAFLRLAMAYSESPPNGICPKLWIQISNLTHLLVSDIDLAFSLGTRFD